MVTLMIVILGTLATYAAYSLAREKGRHRRAKRGVWDFGMTKMRKDAEEEYQSLTSLLWKGDLGWTGAKLA